MSETKNRRFENGNKKSKYAEIGMGKIHAQKPLPKTEPKASAISANGDLRAKKG